jgi:hypothetical protein
MTHATGTRTRDGWSDRMLVAKWLEIKFLQENHDTEAYRRALGEDYERLTMQLQYDAMHSSLLGRLLNGEEPRDV